MGLLKMGRFLKKIRRPYGNAQTVATSMKAPKHPKAVQLVRMRRDTSKNCLKNIKKDLDELPTISKGSKEVLKPGMVVAIEPKFVFPGVGVVGIEDTVVIVDEVGAKYISKSPRELIIL